MIQALAYHLALTGDIRLAVIVFGAFDQGVVVFSRECTRPFMIQRNILVEHLADGVIER